MSLSGVLGRIRITVPKSAFRRGIRITVHRMRMRIPAGGSASANKVALDQRASWQKIMISDVGVGKCC